MRFGAVHNKDGSLYKPPLTDAYAEALDRMMTCSTGPSYSCMFCNKCPYGEYFKWPAELEEVREAQTRAVLEYMKAHGNDSWEDLYIAIELDPGDEFDPEKGEVRGQRIKGGALYERASNTVYPVSPGSVLD